MIVELFGALLAVLLVGLVGHLLVLGAKNRQKYEFFNQNAPGLKVIENPSLFGGHTNQIVHAKHNWAKVNEVLKKSGPTVGFYYDTRPAVISTDLDFIKVFTVDEQNHTNRIKANLPIEELEEDCLMFAEDEQWLRLRKAIAPAFSAHKLKSHDVHSEISKMIDKFVGLIERRLNEASEKKKENFIDENVEDVCQRYTLALMFANFYKQDNVIDFHSNKDKYVEMVDRGFRTMVSFPLKACAAFPQIKPFVNWLAMTFTDQGFIRNTIMTYIKQQTRLNFEATEQAHKHNSGANKDDNSCSGKIQIAGDQQEQAFDADCFTLKDGSKFKRNMIDYITDQYREGTLSRREYFHSTFFLFFAANKTTSDCLSRLLYNLATNQDAQEKLRNSILVSGEGSEYLAWCIHETLRMHPPVPIGCSRVIKRDIQTKHGLVPAGTFVVTPAYTIGRLKEYWGEHADDFRPERWTNAKNFHPVQYLAFGGGRRACPGKELALMEIKMLINVLMRRYKFEKSTIHTNDNSQHFEAPMFFFLSFDTPTYVRISHWNNRDKGTKL